MDLQNKERSSAYIVKLNKNFVDNHGHIVKFNLQKRKHWKFIIQPEVHMFVGPKQIKLTVVDWNILDNQLDQKKKMLHQLKKW